MRRLKLKLVLLSVVLMVTATTAVHAYDWEGVNIDDLSMTSDGYFEAPISQNAIENGLNGWDLYVFGAGFTLTSVDLIKSNGETKHLLQNLNVDVDNWNWDRRVKIPKDQFQAGDIVRCYFKDKKDSYNPKFFRIKEDGSATDDLNEVQNRIYKEGVASNEVYIYNVETGKFMYIGGDWGTHIELLYSDFGLKFKMKKDGNCYVFTSDVSTQGGGTTGEYLGMMQGYTGDGSNSNGIVADKQKATINKSDKDDDKDGHLDHKYCYSRFNVVPVEGEKNTYTLSLTPREYPQSSYAGDNGIYNEVIPQNKTFYLGVVEELNVETNIVELHVKETESSGYAAKWRFVSVKEIDEAVRNAALSVDAFNGMNLDVTYKIANQGFNRNNENNWDEDGATYLKKSDGDIYKLLDPPTNGKYYYGLLKSASNGGMISRGFYAPATGWYKVQCQGLSKSGNAYAFAKANGDDPVRAPLNKVENGLTYNLTYNEIVSDAHKQDRVDLGVDFYDNKYPVEVYFHAAEGDYIMIGIQQMVGYANDLTAFDDFQIKFLGEVFVLDEDYETCEHADESGNGNGYLDAHEGVTVILHRTFSKKDDGTYYWNTLTLPIDMTGTQVKNVFGDDVKLAVASGLDQSDPYVITFQSVDADNGIQAGQFYLIQPAKEPATPAGQTITINNKTYNGPLYTLGRRDVNPISADLFKDDGWNAPSHNSIRYHGTYLKLENGVPGGSYVFSKGNMYHIKNAQNVKGFRFWIEDEEPNQNGQAKPFTLSISGVEDQQESEQVITTISEVETVTDENAAVYSLSGQFLGKGKQLLNSLPKGIYVVNNKKYMVK